MYKDRYPGKDMPSDIGLFLGGGKVWQKGVPEGKDFCRALFWHNKKDSSINTEIFLAVRRGIEPLFPP